MKKQFKLVSLSLLSLLLIGCNKNNNQPSESIDTGKNSSQPEDKKDVVERWEDLISKDIKVEGSVGEKYKIKDASGTIKDEESIFAEVTTAFSDGKYYSKSVVKADDEKEEDKVTEYKFIKGSKGYAAVEVLNVDNTIGETNPFKNKLIFDEEFINPLKELTVMQVFEPSDDDKSFTFEKQNIEKTEDDDGVLQTNYDLLTRQLTGFKIGNGEIESVVFTEGENKLNIDFTSKVENLEDNDQNSHSIRKENEPSDSDGSIPISVQSYVHLQLTINNGEAFQSLKPRELNESTTKLQSEFDKLLSAKSYTIKHTSSSQSAFVSMSSGEITKITDPDFSKSYSYEVKYDEDGMMSYGYEDGGHGYRKDPSNGKYYEVSSNIDNRLTWYKTDKNDAGEEVDAAIDYLGESGWMYRPCYSLVSAGVFDVLENKDPDDKSINFTMSDDTSYLDALMYLSEDIGSIMNDFSGILQTGYNMPVSLQAHLSSDNKLSISYSVVDMSRPTGMDIATMSGVYNATYNVLEYENISSDVSNSALKTELIPSNLRDEWQLIGDGSSADVWTKDGIELLSELDDNGNSNLTIKNGTNDKTVTDLVVSDGVVSFKMDNKNWTLIITEENDVILSTGEGDNKVEYHLSQKGLQEAKVEAINEVNKVLDSDYDTNKKDAKDAKSCQEIIQQYKQEAIEKINNCKIKVEIVSILEDFNDNVATIPSVADKNKLIISLDSINSSDYDDTNKFWEVDLDGDGNIDVDADGNKVLVSDKAMLDKLLVKLKDEINKSTSKEELNAIVSKGNAVFKNLLTKDQWDNFNTILNTLVLPYCDLDDNGNIQLDDWGFSVLLNYDKINELGLTEEDAQNFADSIDFAAFSYKEYFNKNNQSVYEDFIKLYYTFMNIMNRIDQQWQNKYSATDGTKTINITIDSYAITIKDGDIESRIINLEFVKEEDSEKLIGVNFVWNSTRWFLTVEEGVYKMYELDENGEKKTGGVVYTLTAISSSDDSSD